MKKMNGKKCSFSIIECIHLINSLKVFLLFFFWVATISYCRNPKPGAIFHALLLLVVAIGGFLLRKLGNRVWIFLCGHGVLLLYCFCIGRNKEEKVIYVIYGILDVLVSWMIRRKNQVEIWPENYSSAILFLAIPCLLYTGNENRMYISNFFMCIGMFFLWLHFINFYLVKQEKYLKSNALTTDSINRRSFYLEGGVVLGFFSVFSVGVVYLATTFSTHGVENSVLHALRSFLRWLFHFIHGEKEEYEENALYITPIPKATMQPTDEIKKIGPSWLEKIGHLIGIVVWNFLKVLAVLFILVVIVLFFYTLWKHFYEKKEEMVEEKERIFPEKREKSVFVQKRKRKWNFFDRSYRGRIRVLFQRKVEKSWKSSDGDKELKTAEELSQCMEAENRNKLLAIYQKARYGKTDISKEEYIAMKKKMH